MPYKCEITEKKFGFNFDSNKAFKYDSSDDEQPDVDISSKESMSKSERVDSSNYYAKGDRFLFIVDDPRFKGEPNLKIRISNSHLFLFFILIFAIYFRM